MRLSYLSFHFVFYLTIGFKVDDRFISETPHGSGGANVVATFFLGNELNSPNPNQIEVQTFIPDVDFNQSLADASFMIIVY